MKVYDTNGSILVSNSPEAPFNVQVSGQVSIKEGNTDGQNLAELLYQVLAEMKVTNHYLSELPGLLNSGYSNSDNPDKLRKEFLN